MQKLRTSCDRYYNYKYYNSQIQDTVNTEHCHFSATCMPSLCTQRAQVFIMSAWNDESCIHSMKSI